MSTTLRIFSVLALLAYSVVNATCCFGHSNGAPSGYSGSPGDGKSCTQCHGGSASNVTGWITTNIPPQGYSAGNTYTVTVTFSGSGGKGFEVSPQNVAGVQLGTLVAGTGSKLVGGTKYCTHSSKINSSPATWVFSWTAPAAGTGYVNFYAAYAITENITKIENITVPENILQVSVTAVPDNLCSGTVTQLDATATGGSGNYTYFWSSIPPGFSSSIPNPTANPAVSTQYFVQVNDGTDTVTDSVMVTVQAAPEVSAGYDTTVNLYVTQIPLLGTASNTVSVLWTTSGDGTFSSAINLESEYFPGSGDKTAMSVNLTLTGNPVAPCLNFVSNVRHITFNPFSGVQVLTRIGLSVGVFPNPSNGLFTLTISGGEQGPVYITVTDINGIIHYNKTVITSAKTITKVLDLTSLPSAVYLLKIENGSGMLNRKLVIL